MIKLIIRGEKYHELFKIVRVIKVNTFEDKLELLMVGEDKFRASYIVQ